MPLPDTATLHPKPGFILEEVDGELLIYHPADAEVIYCNPTAALVWRLCDGYRSIEAIIQMLGDCYPESREAIATDVRDTVQTLADRGVLLATASTAMSGPALHP